jgi:hypothetical protein
MQFKLHYTIQTPAKNFIDLQKQVKRATPDIYIELLMAKFPKMSGLD